jgi:hypothetical protein
MFESTAEGNELDLDLNAFANGVYYFNFIYDGIPCVKKFIVAGK